MRAHDEYIREKQRRILRGTGELWSWRVLRVGRVDQNDGRARVGVRHDHQVGTLALCSRERLRVGERVEGREARERAERREEREIIKSETLAWEPVNGL